MFKSLSDLCSVVSALMICQEDQSYLLVSDSETKEWWIPSAKCSSGKWRDSLLSLLKENFQIDSKSQTIVKIVKVWQPSPLPSLFHVVFGVTVNMETKKKIAKKQNARWIFQNDLSSKSLLESLRSTEVIHCIDQVRQKQQKVMSQDQPMIAYPHGPWEDVLGGNYFNTLVEVNEQQVLIVPKQKSGAPGEALLEAAAYFKKEQTALFRQFLLHSFPCLFMSRAAFIKFITLLGWKKEEAPSLFWAADIYGRSSLSFHDVLYLTAILEPITQQAGPIAELRCRYIFRYFTKNPSGKMDYFEFTKLTESLLKLKTPSVNVETVTQEADKILKSMNLGKDVSLTMTAFLQAVGSLKIRGTSSMLRAPKSLLAKTKELQGSAGQLPEDGGGGISNLGKAATQDYELAIHTIKLKKSGISLQSVNKFWEIDGLLSKSSTFLSKTNQARPVSVSAFSKTFCPNEILKGLYYFAEESVDKQTGKKKEAFTWGKVDTAGFAKALISLCDTVGDILRQEPRLIEVCSPVFVLGDIHGNVHDLLILEKALWSMGPMLTPSGFLFLGDYVDRGAHSVEVVAYLFSYKVLNPCRVWLLRGNHEIRDVQLRFTFLKECTAKFGDSLGKDVWQAVNTVFDALPLAAVIDDKVFCCHGGIPPPWLCPVVSAINTVKCPLPKPDEQSHLAWDIMWNDPVRKDELTEEEKMELLTNSGFATNNRRGTAHIFDTNALEAFLLVNGFSLVLRAHEVQNAGFKVQQKGKLFTVFSSSHYSGGANEAACILFYNSVMRVFRLDSSNY